MPEVFDIAIVGGGIVGAALAHAIGGRASVVLIERETAWGYHATGRSAAEVSLRFHSDMVGHLTLSSLGFLQAPPEGFCEVPLLRRCGNMLIATADKADRAREVFVAETQATGPDQSAPIWLDRAEMLRRVPFLDPDRVAAAFFDPDCWDVDVDALLQAYLRSARRAGARLLTGTTLEAARHEKGHWRLETTTGALRARTVVNAAGAWADPVAALFGADRLELRPLRRTMIRVRMQGHDLTGLPEVNEIDEAFYFKPDAGHLLVSPADETPVEPHDAWAEELDIAMAAHALTEVTTLDLRRVEHAWAGLRTFSPDRMPVIGASASLPGLFWLAGLGGFGIQTSPAVARIAAGLLLDGGIPPDLGAGGITALALSPARFGG